MLSFPKFKECFWVWVKPFKFQVMIFKKRAIYNNLINNNRLKTYKITQYFGERKKA